MSGSSGSNTPTGEALARRKQPNLRIRLQLRAPIAAERLTAAIAHIVQGALRDDGGELDRIVITAGAPGPTIRTYAELLVWCRNGDLSRIPLAVQTIELAIEHLSIVRTVDVALLPGGPLAWTGGSSSSGEPSKTESTTPRLSDFSLFASEEPRVKTSNGVLAWFKGKFDVHHSQEGKPDRRRGDQSELRMQFGVTATRHLDSLQRVEATRRLADLFVTLHKLHVAKGGSGLAFSDVEYPLRTATGTLVEVFTGSTRDPASAEAVRTYFDVVQPDVRRRNPSSGGDVADVPPLPDGSAPGTSNRNGRLDS
jgi:hypothetical protein